jgi:NADH-quinone oxidoreductase subunit G
VMARDNEDVEDGWLCDKGRYGYQAVHSPERVTQPMVNDGGALRETSWERALSMAATGLEKAGAATAGLAGGETTNEEGFLL